MARTTTVHVRVGGLAKSRRRPALLYCAAFVRADELDGVVDVGAAVRAEDAALVQLPRLGGSGDGDGADGRDRVHEGLSETRHQGAAAGAGGGPRRQGDNGSVCVQGQGSGRRERGRERNEAMRGGLVAGPAATQCAACCGGGSRVGSGIKYYLVQAKPHGLFGQLSFVLSSTPEAHRRARVRVPKAMPALATAPARKAHRPSSCSWGYGRRRRRWRRP